MSIALIRSRPTLRFALPLALLVVLLAVLGLSLANTLWNQQAEFTRHASADLLAEAHHMARMAERALERDPGIVAADLTHAATDPRITAAVILDPTGRVILAQRFAWKGQPARDVVPGFDAPRFHLATQGRMPDLRLSPDKLRMSVLLPYATTQSQGQLRALAKGAVFLAYDLSAASAELRAKALRERAPDLVATTLLMALLAWLLARLVARPLSSLEAASRRLAEGERLVTAAEAGPAEVANLARGFNHMARAVQSAQTALKASEERLAVTLHSIGDALLATDTEGRVTLMNPIAEQLTGWTFQEASQRHIGEIFRIENADTGAPAEIPVDKVIEQGIVVGLANHTVLVSRDEARYHIADSAAPIRDNEGKLIGVVLVFQDVSEEYQLRRAVAESEQHFRNLADSGQALIWTSGTDKLCGYFNAPWLAFTGRTLEQELGNGWTEGVHQDDFQHCLETYVQAFDRREKFSMTYRLRRHDGEYRWILDEGSPRYNSQGQFLGYVGHCIDITDSKRLVVRQQAQLRLLERVIRDTPISILLEDLVRFVEGQAPGLRCSILLAEADKLRIGAAPSLPESYNRMVDGLPIAEGNGSCGTAAARRRAVVVSDVRQDRLWNAYMPEIGDYGWLRACWSTPFFDVHGHLLGTFAVYSGTLGVPDSAENELIQFAASLASLIVERRQDQEQLRTLSRAVQQSPAHIVITDPNDLITYVNPRFSEITGYSREESLGKPLHFLMRTAMNSQGDNLMLETLRAGDDWRGEFVSYRKNGQAFWESASISAIRDALGRITHYSYVKEDISTRKQAEEKIHRLAFYDALTGLPNRRLLQDRLTQTLAAARRSQQVGAVMFVDLDQFKRVNDARGHAVGDALLKQVSALLLHHLRAEDTVARLGGDEFVVLLPNLASTVEMAARLASGVAEKILATLDVPLSLDDGDYHLGASIGITVFPKDREGVDDLLREADTAMYRSKASGRNRFSYFEPAMQTEVKERLDLEQSLREAITQQTLSIYLQPQVDVTGRLRGAEVLLRWQHPTQGRISPTVFIPVAEESSLIITLGEWVLSEACQLLKTLDAAGRPLRLAVNVSPRQFRQADFAARVQHILRQTGADPSHLMLEVTEGVLIESLNETVAKMTELSSLGVHFSIDDFGTGYSSLAYLKRLPIHELKIDKTFVQDAPQDGNDAALVEAILSVAHHLNLHVVAEGVETVEHFNFLKARGCSTYQGYHFDRPLPWEQFRERWLTDL